MQQPIKLINSPCWLHYVWLILMYCYVVIVVCKIIPLLFFKILAVILITRIFRYYYQRYVLLTHEKSIQLCLFQPQANKWQLHFASKEIISAKIAADTVVFANMVVLRFKPILNKKIHSVVLFKINQSEQYWRYLQVYLRYGQAE